MRSFSKRLKVALFSFSVSIPPKFEHKLRRRKQSFGKIATTVIFWQKVCVYKCEPLIIQGIVSKFHIFVHNNS